MEIEKAIAYKDFVLEAFDVHQGLLESTQKYSKEEIEQFKLKFSEEEFNQKNVEFEKELYTNLSTYSNENITKAYLKNVFKGACRQLGDEDEIVAQIIEKGDETNFTLMLLNSLLLDLDNFVFYSQTDTDNYIEIEEYFENFIKEYEKLNDTDTHKGPKIVNEYKEEFVRFLLDRINAGAFAMEGLKGESSKKAVIEAFSTFLDEDLQAFRNKQATQKQTKNIIDDTKKEVKPNTSSKSSDIKTFDKYLLHKDSLQLADALKTQFSTEKGKAIRILIEVLKETNPPVLAIATGEKKAFYEAMHLFFGRDIGKYSGIFDYVIKPGDTDVMEALKTRVDYIMEQIK